MQLQPAVDFLTHIDWTKPTWDMFIVLFFIVAAFLYGLSLGKSRIVVILVSIYMALAVVNTAPFLQQPTSTTLTIDNTTYVVQISAFIGAFVLLFFLLSRSAILGSIAPSAGDGSWWQAMLFSFLHVGLLISVTLSFLPAEASAQLSEQTRQIFVGEHARFWWVVAPIVAMLLIRKKEED